jgi:beta-mannanase
MSYEYVEYVLANYLASGIGQSEDEAVSALRMHIEGNPSFGVSFRAELQQALTDEAYSWKSALENFDVVTMNSEKEAKDLCEITALGFHLR